MTFNHLPLAGVITALITPFTSNGAIDLDAWQRLISEQLDAGISGLVVAGSTGEAATLSDQEYDTLLQHAVLQVQGRVPVLAGTGLSGTHKTILQSQRAAQLGANAALVVTPPYVRATQAGLHAHYTAVADQAGLPVVLYNVPIRTGCDLLPSTVAALAQHPNIIGIKEAVSDPQRISALLELQTEHFSVLSGDDATALESFKNGARGLISVGSNALPSAFSYLYALAQQNKYCDLANALQDELQAFYRFFGVEPNPIPVKSMMQKRGFGQGLRLPLMPLSDTYSAEESRLVNLLNPLEVSAKANLFNLGK